MCRARDFVTWMMVTWQTVVQVSVAASARRCVGRTRAPSPPSPTRHVLQVGKRSVYSPRELRRFYAALSVFQFDSSAVLHPACYTSTPFNMERNQFVGSIVCGCVLLLLTAVGAAGRGPSWLPGKVAVLRRLAMTMLTIMYPMEANSVFTMINCRCASLATCRSVVAAERACVCVCLFVCMCVCLCCVCLCVQDAIGVAGDVLECEPSVPVLLWAARRRRCHGVDRAGGARRRVPALHVPVRVAKVPHAASTVEALDDDVAELCQRRLSSKVRAAVTVLR
jgi:hypothetical protein